MDNKFRKLLSDFGITLFANILTLAVSTLVILILPACISVKSYGYWQLYLLYTSYTAYFSLGITDGLYIRNGGKKYEDLNTDLIRPQYWFLLIFNILLTLFLTVLTYFYFDDFNKVVAIFFACISGVIVIPRSVITMTMLSANRIKQNAYILIVDRIVYLILIVTALTLKFHNFYFFIFADLMGQFASACLAICYCKKLVFGKFNISLKVFLKEIKINISIGIKIVIAGLASILIIGIIRFAIESNWGVEEFAKISLTLSICNLLLVFIKSISVVLFPVLCTSEKDGLKKIYLFSNNSLSVIVLGGLIFYLPAKCILSLLLPQYAESLKYMAFLFPIALFECKTQMLLNTYFKVLRKEKLLMVINLITVIFSLALSFVSTQIFNSMSFAIISIVILLSFRCYIAEVFLLKIFDVHEYKDIIMENIMSILFIYFNWNIGELIGMFLYLGSYLIYLFIKRKTLIEILNKFKVKFKKA